jgi:predicted RNase H-like HicB family nuclease
MKDIAIALELPGCWAFGETPEAALEELHIAAELWIEAAKQMRRAIPLPVDEPEYN